MKHSKISIEPDSAAPSPTSRRTVESLARAAQGRSVEERELVDCARQLIRARREMNKHIPAGLLKDDAWDILLELFVNGEEGGIVYVKQIMLACGVTSTSAVRLIDRLEEGALIARVPDPLDHRRVIVSLSERGRQAMTALLRKIVEQPDDGEVAAGPTPFAPRRTGGAEGR